MGRGVVRRTRTILAATLLSALLSLGFVTQGSFETQGAFTAAGQAVAGAFVTVAESDFSAPLQARLPNIYGPADTPVIDTSGFTVVNATTDGAAQGCTNVSTTGDQGANIRCFWDSLASGECLYFPNGTYTVTTNAGDNSTPTPAVGGNPYIVVYDRTDSGKCFRGQSRTGTIFEVGGVYPDDPAVNFMAGSSSDLLVWGGAEVTWSSGFAKGTTSGIVVSDSTDFEVGGWVFLAASANSVQTHPAIEYFAKITAIDSGTDTLTIDRPLPDDFDGGSQTARPWTPATGIAWESFTVRPAEPDHQQLGVSVMFHLRHIAESSFTDVHFEDVYEYGILLESSARVRGHTFNIDGNYDKNFNNYLLAPAGGSSDTLLTDFALWNGPQAISCAGNAQQTTFGFFAIMNPEDNQPDFDRTCTGGTCDQTAVDHTFHGTTTGSGYTHCSNSVDDVAGTSSAAQACRGVRTDQVSGSVLFHGESCNNSSFIRGYAEGGFWSDFFNGAGRNNFIFGVSIVGPGGDPSPIGAGIGALGDIGFKDGGVPNGGTYRNNVMIVNSSINTLGTGAAFAFDPWMDDARIEFNVLRSGCRYDGGTSPNATAASACTFQDLEYPGSDVNGTITWNSNDVGVGSSARSFSDVMPTAPGFDSSFEATMSSGSGTFPWFGADMGGNGGVGSNCNPAYLRYYGSC